MDVMIGRLQGHLVTEDPPGKVVLDVGGVGYEVTTPIGTSERAIQKDGTRVLIVHTHVREDAFELFGFASDHERTVFRMLLDVPNVGPKTALGVLSALPADELAAAVRTNDVKRLQAVPGVGKKTAERMILELKEKALADPLTGPARQVRTPVAAHTDKLLTALTSMGYKPAEAERAVRHLGDDVQTKGLAELLREALQFLTR
jgi:Holliday junction DNA helicase RuvA